MVCMYSATYLTNLFPPCSCLLPWAETDIKRSDRDNRNVIRWHGNIQLSVRVPTHWQPSEDLSGQWFLVRICAFLSRSVSLYIHDEKYYNYIVHLVMWFTDCCMLTLSSCSHPVLVPRCPPKWSGEPAWDHSGLSGSLHLLPRVHSVRG